MILWSNLYCLLASIKMATCAARDVLKYLHLHAHSSNIMLRQDFSYTDMRDSHSLILTRSLGVTSGNMQKPSKNNLFGQYQQSLPKIKHRKELSYSDTDPEHISKISVFNSINKSQEN